MRKVLKISYYTTISLMIVLSAWIMASYLDVVTHNLNPDPVYKAWNLFVLLF